MFVVELGAESEPTPAREVILREAFDTLRVAVKYGTFAYMAYCGWQSVSALAGKSTGADLGLAVNAAIQFGKDEWPPWVLVLLITAWALTERRLRRAKTAQLASQDAELERQLDPLRDSSGLTATGETRKDDRP